ncbi:hypothetical protein Micbo1qcDRAFT_200610 [Microdochium bolleyi]|uniref:Uncharacterized protein n=1 Tax=Microdochium bolleyi TaxID=196109 RepID=A0A136JDD8_9PEZI|nr:hypothetical protein Micbo1qcDRAFT_200610 [Microdochium bolleyi]
MTRRQHSNTSGRRRHRDRGASSRPVDPDFEDQGSAAGDTSEPTRMGPWFISNNESGMNRMSSHFEDFDMGRCRDRSGLAPRAAAATGDSRGAGGDHGYPPRRRFHLEDDVYTSPPRPPPSSSATARADSPTCGVGDDDYMDASHGSRYAPSSTRSNDYGSHRSERFSDRSPITGSYMSGGRSRRGSDLGDLARHVPAGPPHRRFSGSDDGSDADSDRFPAGYITVRRFRGHGPHGAFHGTRVRETYHGRSFAGPMGPPSMMFGRPPFFFDRHPTFFEGGPPSFDDEDDDFGRDVSPPPRRCHRHHHRHHRRSGPQGGRWGTEYIEVEVDSDQD